MTASRVAWPPLLLCAAISLALCPRAASAESESSERAQRLFDEARTLMKDGHYAEACPKLAESQTLDPGGGTILNLGICLRRQGRNSAAWETLQQALAQARTDGRADRQRTAEKQLAELNTVLSRLVLRLSPDISPEPVTVTLDGVPLSAEHLGTPLPIDPGTHEVRASAALHQSWSVQISVPTSAGEQQLTIPALQPEARAEAVTMPPLPTPAPLPVVTPPPPPRAATNPGDVGAAKRKHPDEGLRPEAYAAFGVGAAALGVGSYFGIRSLSLKSDSNRYWNGQKCTEPSCVEDWNKAQSSAVVCDVSLGVGLLALGVGTYFLLNPAQQGPAPVATRIQVRASQAGAFVSSTTSF